MKMTIEEIAREIKKNREMLQNMDFESFMEYISAQIDLYSELHK